MPTYVEMVRTRRHTQDASWLVKALEAGRDLDRLPPVGVWMLAQLIAADQHHPG